MWISTGQSGDTAQEKPGDRLAEARTDTDFPPTDLTEGCVGSAGVCAWADTAETLLKVKNKNIFRCADRKKTEQRGRERYTQSTCLYSSGVTFRATTCETTCVLGILLGFYFPFTMKFHQITPNLTVVLFINRLFN